MNGMMEGGRSRREVEEKYGAGKKRQNDSHTTERGKKIMRSSGERV